MRISPLLIGCLFGLSLLFLLPLQSAPAVHGENSHHNQHASMPVEACLSVCIAALPDVSTPSVAVTIVFLVLAALYVFSERRRFSPQRLPRFLLPVPLGTFVGTTLLRE